MSKFGIACDDIFPGLQSQIHLERCTDCTNVIQQLPKLLLSFHSK